MQDVIKVSNLTKVYGRKRVLNGVNLTLEKGQIYGLVGKNGVGKTTLMRIVTGLSFKTDGEYEMFGAKTEKELLDACHRVGTMIETPAFYPYMTARQNLEYYRLQRGVVEKDRVEKVLEEVGLTDTGKKQFKNFSVGMKQRLGLALALLGSPDLLILDEPINGLDPEGIVEFRNVLKRLNVENNITMMISSHILTELSSIATCYGFMKDGSMVEEISAVDLESKCKACVEVEVSDAKRVTGLLETNLGCTQYEVLPNNHIRVYQYYDDPSILSDLIVLNGIKLKLLEVKSTDLENYFLELLGGNQ